MGAQLTWFNATYLSIRLALWASVAAMALIDWLIHRNDKPKGWQLHRIISIVLLVYVVQEASTTAYATIDGSDSLYMWLIFVYNLADSLFLGLLLLISCGWQITRESLAGRKFIFWFPPIHFVCSTTVDYILDRYIGHDDAKEEVAVIPDEKIRTLLICAYFGSIITLFYGWWWIFTCIAIERSELEQKISEGQQEPDTREYDTDDDDSDRDDAPPVPITPGAGAESDPDSTEQRVRLESIDLDGEGDDEDEVVFEAPVEGGGSNSPRRGRRRARADRARARAGQLGETLLSGGGSDANSFAEADDSNAVDHSAMPDRAKLRMLTQYGIMVQVYLFIVLMILLVNAWNQERPTTSIVVLEMLNMIFLAGLLYTFRLRATNPYYLLDETTFFDDSYGGNVQSSGIDEMELTEVTTTSARHDTAFAIGDPDENDEEV